MLVFTGIYKEVAIDHKLVIPPEKPPMECIIDTSVEVEIEKAVVIDTPLLYPEDPALQLRKVVVVGKVTITVKYVAHVPSQKVHAAHFVIPFCSLIEWPGGPPQGTPITVVPVTDKTIFEQEHHRRIFKAILIRLDVYR